MKKLFVLAFCLFPCFLLQLRAQDEGGDLLSQLGDEPSTNYTTATFKTTRLINGHTIENVGAGVLDFKISHRFTPVRQGIYDFFGLDGASIRLGLDYGITPRLMVGIGRNSREKIVDGFAKYKLLRQSSGKKNMPITLSYLIDAQIKTIKFQETERDNKFSSRIYYTHQVLIGRKFSNALSLQLAPTLLHRNLVATENDPNDVFALGAGGRIKLTRRVSFNAEYYYVIPGQLNGQYANCLSIGFDIETGGHVFQLHFSNSPDMTYKGFITETPNDWFYKQDGHFMSDVRFGFNISRVFTVRKPKGLRD